MLLKLWKKPKNPVIVQGFPGFGMVGAIATQFLIEHLNVEQIGKIVAADGPAMTAIHDGAFMEPFGIYYNKKHNLVILHAIMAPRDKEWMLAETVLSAARQLGARNIISLEGVGSLQPRNDSRVFFYATAPQQQRAFKKLGLPPLNEGIVLGITAALLVLAEKQHVSCLFAETHSAMPDSKAAAKLIRALDSHLGLKVDYKPLLVMAEQFEDKLRGIMKQSQNAQLERDQKAMSYVG